MSRVKLIVRPRNSLGNYKVIEVPVNISNDTEVEAVVHTDFDPAENGERQVSDNLDPVIHIENMNNLTGRVLTIADAAFQDPEQRKAVKDLLQKATWDWYHDVREYPSKHWYSVRKNYTTIKD